MVGMCPPFDVGNGVVDRLVSLVGGAADRWSVSGVVVMVGGARSVLVL